MTKKIALSTFIIVAMLSLTLISCSKSSDETHSGTVTDYQIKLSETTLTISSEETEENIQLTTDVDWIATTSVNWIHISPSQGKSSANIIISIDANNNTEDRKAEIIFKNEKGSVTLHILQSKQEQKPKIGDYLYSDGTWSSQLDYEKTPLGIIFSTETTEKDKELGYKRGYAMTIAPPSMRYSTGVSWSTVDRKEFSDSYTTIQEALNDRDGLTKTIQIAQTDDYQNKYPAFYKAYDFLVNFYPEWTSPRFLPSAGQWRDIIVNLGGASSENDFISEGGDVIWEVSTSIVNNINSYLEPCIEHPVYTGFKAIPGAYWYFKSGFYHCSTELSSTKFVVMHFALNEGWYLKGISYPAYYYFTRIGGLDKTSSVATGYVRPCFAF